MVWFGIAALPSLIALLYPNSRRVHITLEIPFNSTNFVQQLGRSHRSNQVTGPEYLAVITDLPVNAFEFWIWVWVGVCICVYVHPHVGPLAPCLTVKQTTIQDP